MTAPTIPEHTGYAEFVDDAGREAALRKLAADAAEKFHDVETPEEQVEARILGAYEPSYVWGCHTEGYVEPTIHDFLRDAIPAIPALLDAIDAHKARADRAEAALRGLVDRLDMIHEDSAFKSVWMVNQVHCGPYTGPTYVDALEAARATLAALEPK